MSGSKFKKGDKVQLDFDSKVVQGWAEDVIKKYFKQDIYTVISVEASGDARHPYHLSLFPISIYRITDKAFRIAAVKDTKMARKLYKGKIKEIKDGKIYFS